MDIDVLNQIERWILKAQPTTQTTLEDGRVFIQGPAKELKPIPPIIHQGLTFNTLAGFMAMAKRIQEEDDKFSTITIHISDHNSVRLLLGCYQEDGSHPALIGAKPAPFTEFQFVEWYSIETFIIELMSKFVQTEPLAQLIQVISSLSDDTNVGIEDSGVAQTVTVQSGVASKTNAVISPRIVLKPFRTFVEVDQPSSLFLFRMKKTDHGIRCALFEADGGLWKIQAMKNIHDELAKIDSIIPILM